MPRAKYPLDTLVRLRADAADEGARALADATRAREAMARAAAAAEAERRAHDARAAEVRDGERARLLRGELTVADLAREDAFQARAALDGETLCLREASARDDESEARASEARRVLQLAARLADRDVLAKDKQRFTDKLAREELAREEEAAEEAFRPRRA